MDTKAEYEKLIAEYDKLLNIARAPYIASPPEKLPDHVKHVNELLDERLRLMALRDAE